MMRPQRAVVTHQRLSRQVVILHNLSRGLRLVHELQERRGRVGPNVWQSGSLRHSHGALLPAKPHNRLPHVFRQRDPRNERRHRGAQPCSSCRRPAVPPPTARRCRCRGSSLGARGLWQGRRTALPAHPPTRLRAASSRLRTCGGRSHALLLIRPLRGLAKLGEMALQQRTAWAAHRARTQVPVIGKSLAAPWRYGCTMPTVKPPPAQRWQKQTTTHLCDSS